MLNSEQEVPPIFIGVLHKMLSRNHAVQECAVRPALAIRTGNEDD